MTRFSLLVLGPLLLLGAVPAPGAGQRSDTERVGCWKGRPLPDCRSFWLVEMQGNLPVAQTSRVSRGAGGREIEWDAFQSTLEWNLGHMVGVAPGWAAGGVVTLGTGSSDALTGLRGAWITSSTPGWGWEAPGPSWARVPSVSAT